MLSAENSGKPLGGRVCGPNPAVEFTALPDLLADGDGLLPPPHPTPALGLWRFVLAPNEKPVHALPCVTHGS